MNPLTVAALWLLAFVAVLVGPMAWAAVAK